MESVLELDIRRLLIDLRKVWKEDLQVVQTEIGVVHQKVRELEMRDTSRDTQLPAVKLKALSLKYRNCTGQRPRSKCTAGTEIYVSEEFRSQLEVITTAFRVRKSTAALSEAPRDTIAITRDIAVKSTIMNGFRAQGIIQYYGHEVAIYVDVCCPDRKEGIGTCSQKTVGLWECSLKYRWGWRDPYKWIKEDRACC
ncbi:Hypothetical predicted protein [Pelobates cultripes]|uniref:Uncharacterized protein n=1 Tax=Pelobates cultripes TaxID=61616 RepID=A0AAD1WNM4_PELCU|nr:Hypothetical predicted protein [Pelobates cultripes]